VPAGNWVKLLGETVDGGHPREAESPALAQAPHAAAWARFTSAAPAGGELLGSGFVRLAGPAIVGNAAQDIAQRSDGRPCDAQRLRRQRRSAAVSVLCRPKGRPSRATSSSSSGTNLSALRRRAKSATGPVNTVRMAWTPASALGT
jgi:hypothetical protein